MKTNRFLIVAAVCLAWSWITPSMATVGEAQWPYYGADFYRHFPSQNPLSTNQPTLNVHQHLHSILTSYHIRRPGDFDRIVKHCDEHLTPHCYRRRYFSYKEARTFLFGHLHLEQNNGAYSLTSVYCQKVHTSDQFPVGREPAPGRIPDWRIVNAEHTWPQSRFSSDFPSALQKSDLHGLYPADSTINSVRSNLPFGEVDVVTHDSCPGTRKGTARGMGQQIFFEPPAEHKGNVARSLFYFSVHYRLPLDSAEEAFLRKWHQEDPVDDAERARNEEIFELQSVRNPFIDHPELVNAIDDF